ncbi:MAG: hypothetical protein IKB60_01755 [Clostridia bacterium]|nr:hypothetical protein [Clostridia bacterium]
MEIKEVKYLPLLNSVSCTVDTYRSLSSSSYQVKTNGLKDVNGESADFSGQVDITAEYSPSLYDVSILSVAYMQNGKLTYKQPSSGASSAIVTLVNSASEMKKVKLVYSLVTPSNEKTVLIEKPIEIDGETKITDMYDLTIAKNQMVNIYIK